MSRLFIGIDPGKTGAIASIYLQNYASLPVIKIHNIPDEVHELYELVRNICGERPFDKIDLIHERVTASPQMGVVSAFTFGKGYGRLEMVVEVASRIKKEVMTVEKVLPSAWQTSLDCLSHGNKTITYKKAKILFPDLKFTKSQADALLIAYYGYKKHGR